MPLKDVLHRKLDKITDGVVPQLLNTWDDIQKRLDSLNCSLANRAVPKCRRSVVSELILQQKAEQAGQKIVDIQNQQKKHIPEVRE